MPSPDSPDSSTPEQSILGGLSADELLARGMQSVRMSGGGATNGQWEPPSDAEAAKLFPQFEILGLLGRGGMGAVYKGRQIALDRIVAIKLLPLEVSVDKDFADRFVREARTMARLNHPSIVSVFDFGHTTEGHLYFVMEFVEGATLHQVIKTGGFTPAQALEIIVAVCEALHYAHSEGVVHRDIKPANVLVDVKGRVKVTDFGLARLNSPTAEQWGQTMTGAILGTPDYMAPEQKRGMHVDHRADIYSLGVMLYEMLCGQVPQGIFDPPSMRVEVDERVDQVVIRAMQQEPDRRYADTAEMKTDVETIRASARNGPPPPRRPPGSPPIPPPPKLTSAPRIGAPSGRFVPPGQESSHEQPKSRAPVFVGAALALIAAAAAGWFVNQGRSDSGKQASNEASPVPATPPLIVATTPPEPVAATPVPATPVPATPAPVAVVPSPDKSVVAITPVAPPPAVDAAPMPVATPAPLSVPAVSPLAPPPVEAQPAGPAWRQIADQAEFLLNKQRDRDGAMDAYERAIDAAEQTPVTASGIEIARLCRRLGSLQETFGSGAEAKRTYEHGRQLLIRYKPKGNEVIEQAKLLGEIEVSLKKVHRD